MAEKQTVQDMMRHLDDARIQADLARACVWGAIRGTAPRDRWDMAAGDLKAATEALARAVSALDAVDKLEPYCTECGEPVLFLMAGWSHISTTDHVEPRQAGHEVELDWRLLGGADGG